MMKNNFDKKIANALEAIARGEDREKVLLRFSPDEQAAARELIETAAMLSDTKESFTPDPVSFRALLHRLPTPEYAPVKNPFPKKMWRLGVPVAFAFAACLLFFVGIVRYRSLSQPSPSTNEGIDANGVISEITREVPEVGLLTKPLPPPDANIDNTVSALLSDMQEETNVLTAEANVVKNNINNTNTLPESYDPNQI